MLRRTRLRLCLMSVPEALKVFGMDAGVPFPRGKSGVYGQAALVGANKSGLTKRYKELARVYHPDQPMGDAAEMSKVNQAYDVLKRELPGVDNPVTNEEDRRSETESSRYEKPNDETFRKREEYYRKKDEEEYKRAQSQASRRASSHTGPEIDDPYRQIQANRQRKFVDMLKERARAEREAAANAPPPETDPVAAQLKRENGGSVRKKSNVKAKAGSWM